MFIPERARAVHKIVVPFFLLKLGVLLLSVGVLFFVFIGVDYIQVLGNLAENKRLKGENFRLRQEVQQIRNRVESMESTIERVTNYARKLQMLTGQGKSSPGELPTGGGIEELEPSREPAEFESGGISDKDETTGMLEKKVEQLQSWLQTTEGLLSRLQTGLLEKRAMMAATPSFLPVGGWISSSFGRRRHPYDSTYRLHTGVDIAAEPGSPVRAPADGLVIFSGYQEGYGKVVVINHGYNITSLVAHNSELFIQPGTRVKRGEVVARVGSTGMATGAHVHFEIRKNGVPVNPETFLMKHRF